MAKAFSIRDLMDNDLRQQDDIYKRVSVYDVESNPGNEYSLSEIEKMKDSIFALGGVQQNIVIVEFPDGAGADHKYLALDGHRRLLASRELVEEGHNEFEFIPAVIKGKLEAGMDGAVLVMMNSTQRNKTDWEKVMEHMKLKEIIPRLKKRQGVDGRTRDIEADMLGVSRTQVNIYNTIGTRLHDDLMELFRTGGIGISLAYEAAKQEPGIQMQLVELVRETNSITEEDIKRLSVSRIGNGQQELPEKKSVKENVSESDTFLKTHAELIPAADPAKEDVSESDTSGKNQNQPVYAPPEKKIVCSTTNKDDVDAAIYFIFRIDDFPESKLQELFSCYMDVENNTSASISAEVRFNKMLPYENGSIRVTRKGGYRIEYIHTGEIHDIPVYYFWKGFEREFEENWKREEIEQTDTAEKIENVSESDICDKPLAAVENEGEVGGQEIKFRGGYEPALVDDLIKQYTSYLAIAVPAEKKDSIKKHICKCNCLLDALDLLREKLNEEESGNDL